MNLIFATERGQLDSNEGIERRHFDFADVLGFRDIRIKSGLPGADHLVAVDHVDRVAR